MSGRPVAVAVNVPRLAVDRPFTYRLPAGAEPAAGLGSLVQVPFHGRNVQGWVLGDTEDVPARVSDVRKVLSPVRFFDEALLELYRWIAHRYLMPLAVAIDRGIPPRIVSEEAHAPGRPARSAADAEAAPRALRVRPLPGAEAADALAAVRSALADGRTAIVLVPEAEGGSHLARTLQA